MDEIPTTFPCPLPISPNRHETRPFPDITSLLEYLTKQNRAWGRIFESSHGILGNHSCKDLSSVGLNKAIQLIEGVDKSSQHPEAFKVQIAEAYRVLSSKYVVVTDSSRGKTIQRLLDNEGVEAAATAFHFFQGGDPCRSLPRHVMVGLTAAAASEITETEYLIRQITTQVDEARKTNLAHAGFVKQTHKLAGELESRVKQSHEDLDQIKKLFKENMTLLSPHRHWKDRQKNARIASFIASVAMIAVLVSGGVGYYWIRSSMPALSTLGESNNWAILVYDHIAPVALLVAVMFWMLKLLGRIFLSNIHLATEAGERVTMIMTYLALLRRDKTTQDDRSVLLQSIFRPSDTGLVQSGSVPSQDVDVNFEKVFRPGG